MTTIYIKQFAIDALFNADKPPIGGAVSTYLYRDELCRGQWRLRLWPWRLLCRSCMHLATDMTQYPCDNCHYNDKWEAPAPQPEAPAAVQPESATCGCTPWEQQHCAGARSPYAEHPHCERMKAPSAVQPVPAPADVLLSVIQTLNAVPYNLTKRECIAQVEAMRAAHLATGDAS